MIEQPDFDERGYRYVRCLNCLMGAVEHRDDPQELLPGMVTRADRFIDYHECPEPYPEQKARWLLDVALSGTPISLRTRAQIWLALRDEWPKHVARPDAPLPDRGGSGEDSVS